MQRISIQRGWRRPAGGFRAGVIALCAMTALFFPVDSIHAQRAGADKPAIHVIGPLAAKEMVTNLTITGLEIEDISALSGLPNLTALNVSGAGKVTDIAPIGRLLHLKTLNLSGCAAVSDIGPLEKLSRGLTSLSLRGTKVGYVTPLARMSRLKTLDLRRCEHVSADDAAWLTQRLSDCKVLSDAPEEKPASTDSGAGGW